MGDCDELKDEDIIINDQDGLPNIHPNLKGDPMDTEGLENEAEDEFDDLPSSLIVTNIHDSVFVQPDKKKEMEDLFRLFDEAVTFQWLRSFRRLRVNFVTTLAAANARVQLHQHKLNESTISCYFAQPVTPVRNASLQPPKPFKQFLISPPASPPLDWEPRPEGEPILNHDLLAALASLAPGASHELHPPSPGQPAIVVHTALAAAAAAAAAAADAPPKQRIAHTACPERSS
ncbi:protein sarah [Atheta coriaria]|uniref:protein sarah n=1 Tax=Dalotia coriaria TaxID=877792 RepID=UPI0031F4753E